MEDKIYDRIVELIMDKHLRPGQRLNEAKLAAAYGVPRSRVRRVLERLRDEELVTIELNKGAFLSRPTVHEAQSVFEARRYLEYTALTLICRHISSDDIFELRRHIIEERQAFSEKRPEANRIAGSFHDLLAKMTRNPILEKLVVGLVRRCVLIQSVYEVESKALCLSEEHEQVVKAIESRDPQEAIIQMSHHFDHIIASLDLTEGRERETYIYAQVL